MNSEERIIALERELDDTRRAAASMMLGMIDAMTRTPEEREEIARSFDKAAAGVDPAAARLAWLVAAALRQRARGRRE
jgi:hypothetical protein